jgi:V/A-type H+-transporting ATPase subunit D
MAKIKLTIQELKKQKEDLKRYRRFLPTLILKKIQIQIELNRIRWDLDENYREENGVKEEINQWIGVVGEEVGITDILGIESIETETSNVAGVEIPLCKRVLFKEIDYDLYSTPLWMDTAVERFKKLLSLKAEALVMERQIALLRRELRTAIQRVNLFEKIKIPEALENIRKIHVFLADQQTAAVVRGKIVKSKIAMRASKA